MTSSTSSPQNTPAPRRRSFPKTGEVCADGAGGGKALPAFITFTGLDARTDLDRVEDLSRRYPIEWGILFSPKRQGEDPRYPSLYAVGRITHRIGNLRLAAHLCGDHARTILATGRCSALTTWIDCEFGRFQINTADTAADPRVVARFADDHGGTGILQCRGLFPNTCEVDWLQDASGGRGVQPERWLSPEERGPFVGYAGGLGPDTIASALQAIQAAVPPNTPYWLDMESRIRTDDRLDLDKCEAVCRAVYGAPAQIGCLVPASAPAPSGVDSDA